MYCVALSSNIQVFCAILKFDKLINGNLIKLEMGAELQFGSNGHKILISLNYTLNQ